MSLTRDQFARAESLYFEATQLPSARWSAFLEEKCRDDEAVRQEVQSLLKLYKPSMIVSSASEGDERRVALDP
jgi:hypothetical protein